jgi:hypothetical protein
VPPFGCTTQSTGELGFADQTLPIISFNDPGSPGQIKILGVLDPTLFQFDSEINIPGAVPGSSLGGVTVHVPDINAIGGVSGTNSPPVEATTFSRSPRTSTASYWRHWACLASASASTSASWR